MGNDNQNMPLEVQFLLHQDAKELFAELDFQLKDGMHFHQIDGQYPLFQFIEENEQSLKEYYYKFFGAPLVTGGEGLERYYYLDVNSKSKSEIDKLLLPLYYCCDWDQHGIDIYRRIHKIFADKGKEIQILTPYDQHAAISENSGNHESRWKDIDILIRWTSHPFNEEQVILLSNLSRSKKWIEEESQDLIEMLKYNGCLKEEN